VREIYAEGVILYPEGKKHMSAGATRDYKKNGRKNNWRRTIWNDVLGRTGGREKRELILYLTGPQDIDRVIAVSKGVPSLNLIGVDLSTKNAKRARRAGVPAIAGDILEVLSAWPNRPVCAVLLDFCSGLEPWHQDLFKWLAFGPFRSAVVMANFQRGRDARTSKIVQNLSRLRLCPIDAATARRATTSMLAGLASLSGRSETRTADRDIFLSMADSANLRMHPPGLHDLHRGRRFVLSGMANMYGGVDISCDLPDEVFSPWHPDRRSVFEWVTAQLFSCKPNYYSYKSGRIVFDSVVFDNPWRNFTEWHRPDDGRWESAIDGAHKNIRADCGEMARQIAAVMAVRTRRLPYRSVAVN
jgi:hypothetical protein